MEQHPIPQQISSYEFKLVGEMTLKQFLKAAIGIVLALILNSTQLIFFLKIPLMLLCGGGGLLMAFVPFQDRPLEAWVAAFIKSIYSPTIYLYKKQPPVNWLDIHPDRNLGNDDDKKEDLPQKDKAKIAEFIKSLPSVKKEEIEIEEVVKEEKPVEKKETIETRPAPARAAAPPEVKEEVKTEDWREQKVDLNLKTERLVATGQADFGSIPMPDIPEVPNIIVGMVTDSEGKIVEDAIIEIQDEAGNPSRVIKTNPLGQFRISTQLANGKYLIVPEKEGLHFNRVDVILKGEIVQPIRIKAANELIA